MIIADTGLWIALFNRRDAYHTWAYSHDGSTGFQRLSLGGKSGVQQSIVALTRGVTTMPNNLLVHLSCRKTASVPYFSYLFICVIL